MKKKYSLKQQTKEPSFQILVAQSSLSPIPLMGHEAWSSGPTTFFLSEVAHGLNVLVTAKAPGDVMQPGLEPVVMPLAEDGEFVDKTLAVQKGVEVSDEGVAIHVQQEMRRPRILLALHLGHVEE